VVLNCRTGEAGREPFSRKELLTFGNFVPVVSAEHETLSKPVPTWVTEIPSPRFSTKSLATDTFNVMEITKMVASHCDNTCTAFRTEPPLTKEVLDCAVTNFFPAGLGDMFSTKDGLLIVARVGIPNSAIEDYVRYLTSAEKKVGKQRETDEKKRQDGLQDRADESGLPLE
jgi:hypothetical protein